MNPIDTQILKDIGLAPPKSEHKDTLGQEDFLELMITQLRNQDPFKPMENGDFLAQMAQFGTVNGIEEMKSSIDNLVDSVYSGRVLEAAGLVGRQVQVESNTAVLQQDKNIEGAVDIPASVGSLVVSIEDAQGNTVRQLRLGAQKAGSVSFSWDGTLQDGSTALPGQYSVHARDGSVDESTDLDTLINTTVSSVSMGKAGEETKFSLENGNTADFSQIRKIL